MKTRRYKVTMYVDVPLFNDNLHIKNEKTMEKYLTDKLGEDDIHGEFEISKAPLPSEINGDIYYDPENITDFEHPVGYIAPDGLFYGVEEDVDPLVHIALARELYQYYKDVYPDRDDPAILEIDESLEHMGFIKIHDSTCRYYTKPKNPVYWTDKQNETVYKWMKHMENTTYVGISRPCKLEGIGNNSGYYWSSEFRQMDKFAVMNCFIHLKA